MEQVNPHLFVYGTLMRSAGHPMHGVIARAGRYLGEAWFPGRLYQVHHYPGAVVSDRSEDRVFGELYRLDSPQRTLAELDDYEGCGPQALAPTEFARKLRPVMRKDGETVAAWIYLYNLPIGAAPRILSGRYRTA